MATGFEIFAKIIPDTKELDKLKREGITLHTRAEGTKTSASGKPIIKTPLPVTLEKPHPLEVEAAKTQGGGLGMFEMLELSHVLKGGVGGVGTILPTEGTEEKGESGLISKIKGLFGLGRGGGGAGGTGAGMGEAAGAEGAGAATGGGIAGGVMMGMGLLEILKKVVGFLAGLEPIQAIMALIGAIMKMFFLPLAMMLFTLLRPILIPLLKLMPAWLKFWRDPIASLKGLGEIIWNAIKGVAEWIYTLPVKIWDKIKGVGVWIYNLPVMIWDYLKGIPSMIWDYLKGVVEWIYNLPVALWDKMKGLGTIIWEYMKALPSQIWDYMKGMADWINALPAKIWDYMKGIGTTIADGISGIIGGLDNTLRQIPGWILDKLKSGISWITNIGGAVANAFKDAFGALVSFFAPMLNPLITVFNAIGSTLAGFVNEVSSHLPGSFRVHWKDISPINVGDFIITKGGQVLKTSPDDYIIGTKNPQAIGGKHIENNIYVNVAGVLDDAMVQEIAYRIRQEVDRAIGVV